MTNISHIFVKAYSIQHLIEGEIAAAGDKLKREQFSVLYSAEIRIEMGARFE